MASAALAATADGGLSMDAEVQEPTAPPRAGVVLVLAIVSAALICSWGAYGFAAVLCLPLLVVALTELRWAAVLFCLALPVIGEPDQRTSILSSLWLCPFALGLAALLWHLFFRPARLYVALAPTLLYGALLFTSILSLLHGFDFRTVPEYLDPYTRTTEHFLAALFFVAGMSAIVVPADWRRLLWTIVLSGLPFAITLFFMNKETEAGGRSRGAFTANSGAAYHLLVCAIASIALFRTSKPRWGRALLIAFGLFYTALQSVTTSRTVIASIPVIFVVWAVLEWGWRRAMLLLLVLGILLLACFPILPTTAQKPIATILAALVSPDDTPTMPGGNVGLADTSTFKVRFIHIDRGLELASERPWLGFGPGTNVWISHIPSTPLIGGPAIHNYYVARLVETGVIGLALYLALLLVIFSKSCRLLVKLRGGPDHDTFEHARASLLIVVGALVLYLTVPGVGSSERHCWFFLGALAGMPFSLRRVGNRSLAISQPRDQYE